MTRHRKTLVYSSAGALVAVTGVLLCGCADLQTPPVKAAMVESAVETGTPFQRGGPMGHWSGSLPSIPLDEALSKVDGTVSLPDTSVVGTMVHVSSDPTAGSLDGTPGLLVLYSSGVELSVGYGVHELRESAEMAPFTDGRKTVNELRQIAGVPVLVTAPGTQTTSHRDNRVPALLAWNAGGLRYTLTASEENQSTDHLIAIMRTMSPAER